MIVRMYMYTSSKWLLGTDGGCGLYVEGEKSEKSKTVSSLSVCEQWMSDTKVVLEITAKVGGAIPRDMRSTLSKYCA